MDFADRKAVVTGGASGIGRAIAVALAEAGADVVAADRDLDGAKRVAAGHDAITAHFADIASDDSVNALRDNVLAQFGRVDIVVNAAGWDLPGPFMQNDPGFWREVVEINYLGQVRVSRAFLEPMIAAAAGGKIVSLASDAGRVGSSGESVYAGAKGGVIAFTKSLAREMARYQINVNCVCPGPTDTPLFATLPEGIRQSLIRAIPFRRLATPEEVADAVLFFASDRARFITGQVLSVSGGLTMAGLTMEEKLAAEYHARGWWREQTLLDDFLGHVAAQPDKTAIVSDHADRPRETLSYGELGALVDRIAGGLIDLGVQPGDVVSYQLPNWWQFAALHLACARIGAVTNAILPILRQREVTFILRRTQSRLCVIPGTFRGFDYAAMLLDVRAEVPTLERIFTVADDTPREGTESFERFFLDRENTQFDRRRPGADSIGQIQFTSGTTGEPKGVVHTYNTMWAGVRSVSEFIGLTSDDVLLACSPMAHTVGFYFGCSLPMMAGMTVVCQDAWDPVRMLELVAAYRIAWTMAAPTFLADVCAAAAATGLATPSMRYISCAGAPIPPSLVTAVQDRLGATVLAAWGMTECGAVTTTRPGDSEEHIKHTDGAPPPWAQLRVVDADGHDLPDGAIGRLLIRGASQALTYYKRPELYAASCHDGWFDTGDLARRYADGYIRLSGRTKDLVIRGGENIPVVEVEAALTTHPAVREVTVVAVADERLGERACAVVVPADPGAPPALASLLDHLAALGMSRHFWPEHLKIVDALPKTATGKIQKFRLRAESASWDLPPVGGNLTLTTGEK